jgi:glutathione S-transferase
MSLSAGSKTQRSQRRGRIASREHTPKLPKGGGGRAVGPGVRIVRANLFIKLYSMSQELLFPALATMIALFVYYSQSIFVARARKKYDIHPPATLGNPDFERVFRVHYNTLEQLPVFLIPLWFYALLVSAYWAGWLGLLWSLGRMGYMYGYYKSAEKRHGFGSVLSYLANIVLIGGALFAIVKGMLV